MAFQQFRLGDLNSIHQPIIQQDSPPTHTTFPTNPNKSVSSAKQPYGSGDSDDGYTLVFANLQEFQAWREQEEERNMVEFVKGDTHGSKAVPPRFKDHTKLVCARHSRSGRKKYVKKHPERVRKVPSRKLDGQGCPASISYKTYFDTEEVRACYAQHHSHEIGLANLPYTRRGRKAAVEREKEKRTVKNAGSPSSSSSAPATSVAPTSAPQTQQEAPVNHISSPPPMQPPPQQHMQPQQQHIQHVPQPQPPQPQPQAQPQQQVMSASTSSQQMNFTNAVSLLAPLPNQATYATTQQSYGQGYGPMGYATLPQPSVSNERWDNMNVLFSTIRDHARTFEYPSASVAALETVLIRLYLESPMGVGTPTPNLGHIMLAHSMNRPGQQQSMSVGGQNAGNDGTIQNDGNS